MADAQAPSSPLPVLIDADNASPAVIGPLLAEVAKFGIANVKRIYGDWTTAKSLSADDDERDIRCAS